MGLLTGGMAMATERVSLNQDKIDVLKREMNYAQFIRQLPKDKRVILDWQALLSVFKDSEGTIWRTRVQDYFYSRDAEHGALDTRLRSDKGSIRIVVHSLSQGQEDAIDLALWDSSMSNAPFVPYKYEPQCFSTLCLIPRQQSTVEFMTFVYGNIVIDLSYSGDNNDVRPVAHYLQSAMEKAVAANPEQRLPARPKITYTVTPTRIKAGETFTVTLPTDYPNTQWDFGFSEELLTPNITYDKKRMNIITLKAVSPGKGVVSFSLMDKKTLWVFTDTVTVNIDPAK